jgi:serine/threonine protein kinase/tetratricopeptide (TPR) repeat protein
MNNERWQEIWDVFFAALERPEAERDEWLAARAGEDVELRREVEALLAGHDKGDSRLLKARELTLLAEDVAQAAADALKDRLLGEQIGPYHIERVIGEGGMGTVYEAEQVVSVRRRVALKVIKLGMDTREIVRRFEMERQALALMTHPNIARIYDAGATPDGRPYFVMELVPGMPVTEYCDRHRLGVRERLQLMMTLCDAIQHAHQKGVVHRDLKPSNILIDTDSATPSPKVIDFGIAKAVGESLTEHTATNASFAIGTPAYMSPEQATFGSVDIDTRTDVYSLAALLYELMVGDPPFTSQSQHIRNYHDALRRVREVEPARPSAQFSTLPVERRSALAESRSATLRELGGQLREIDWIVLKGLAKDRAQRYATPQALAEDIKRFLAGQPVLARPPSRWYRTQKFVLRHRFGVAAFATISLLVLTLAITMTVQSVRLGRALATAERERLRAETVSGFMVELLGLPDPYVSNGESLTVREVLDQGVNKISTELEDEPLVKATLLRTMGHVYRQLGIYEPAQNLLDQALRINRADAEDARGLGNSLNALGELKHDAGDLDAARDYYLSGLDTLRSSFGDDRDVAVTLDNLMTYYSETGDYAEAEKLGIEALRIRRKTAGDESREVAFSMQALGYVYQLTGRYEEAERLYGDGLALLRRVMPANSPNIAVMLNHYGNLLKIRGDWPRSEAMLREALAIYRQTMPKEHSYVAATLNNLSGVLTLEGNYDEAERLLTEAIAIWRGAFGERSASVQTGRYALALVQIGRGQYRLAADQMRDVMALDQELSPDDRRALAADQQVLGTALRELGELDEAESLHRSAVALRTELLGQEHADVGVAQQQLGLTLTALGKLAEADSVLASSLATLTKQLGERQPRTLATSDAIAALRTSQSRYAEAIAMYGTVIQDRRQVLGEAHPGLGESLLGVGIAQCRQGSAAAGRSSLEEARGIFLNSLGPNHPRTRAAGNELVTCSTRSTPT